MYAYIYGNEEKIQEHKMSYSHGIVVEIRTRHIPDTSPECYCYTEQLVWSSTIETTVTVSTVLHTSLRHYFPTVIGCFTFQD